MIYTSIISSSETKLSDIPHEVAAAPHSQSAAVPRSSKEFAELLQMEQLDTLLHGSGAYSHQDDNNSYDLEESKNDSSRAVWDSLFGSEVKNNREENIDQTNGYGYRYSIDILSERFLFYILIDFYFVIPIRHTSWNGPISSPD